MALPVSVSSGSFPQASYLGPFMSSRQVPFFLVYNATNDDLEMWSPGTATVEIILQQAHNTDPNMTIVNLCTINTGGFSDGDNISVTSKGTVNGDLTRDPQEVSIGHCRLPFHDSDGDVGVLTFDSSAEPAAADFSKVEISPDTPQSTNSFQGCITSHGEKAVAVWVKASDGDVYEDDDGGNDTYGADTNTFSRASTVNGISANVYDVGGTIVLAQLILDGPTVKHDEDTLTAPSFANMSDARFPRSPSASAAPKATILGNRHELRSPRAARPHLPIDRRRPQRRRRLQMPSAGDAGGALLPGPR